jgi:hypothetical protein
MAKIINHHALEASGGKTYSELGRYVAADGTDTNDANAALKGAHGKPVANPIRNTAFQASSLETSLWSSPSTSPTWYRLGVMVIVLDSQSAVSAWRSEPGLFRSWPVSSMWAAAAPHPTTPHPA